MSIENWYKGDKRVIIDTADKVAVKSFTKKGFGPEKKSAPKPSAPKSSVSKFSKTEKGGEK